MSEGPILGSSTTSFQELVCNTSILVSNRTSWRWSRAKTVVMPVVWVVVGQSGGWISVPVVTSIQGSAAAIVQQALSSQSNCRASIWCIVRTPAQSVGKTTVGHMDERLRVADVPKSGCRVYLVKTDSIVAPLTTTVRASGLS